jgi:SNF2 family DNA or RNA helicase
MKLYKFQKEFVDRFERSPYVLCGDDMGTGKTFEALALDLRRRTTQLEGYRQTDCKTLIVAPMSVLPAWEKTIKTLWPAARVCRINPKDRTELALKLREPYHYYIVHWEALRLMSDELQSVHWWHVVADEVHRAKNRKAQQTLHLKRLRTSYKTALSGTPADNAPQDLWSILNWLNPKVWSSYHRFTNYFVKIQKHTMGQCTAAGCFDYHKNSFQKIIGVAHVDELHKAMEHFYLRRTKEEVLPDLPEKYYSTIEVDLVPRQRRIYNQMKESMLAWVGKHEHEPIAAPIIVAQLTRLKQFALAYAEVEPVRKMVDGEWKVFDKVKLMDPSTKLDAVMEKILDNPEQRFVVFSESKQIIYLFQKRLTAARVSHVVLTGDTAQSDREKSINEFQAGMHRVFAGTIHAGGEGITLTAASTVIFLDRMWNPSKNKQAEDRCHRIGQQNAVHVIDIVAKDTVDGGRLQQLKLKWSWLRELLGDTKVEINA